ncbi:hypothetical protein F8M41_013888 [Gigaspora margarita]|uniref:Uncharacterized protein n=1 Tax=Gigaspora margarita TaxID=4874 RepID=A0A8H4ARZ4_GIGMA|nr:hypothetical protein F8M41_013888 [Gigaspora margarita]
MVGQITNYTEIKNYTNLLNFTSATNSTANLNSKFQEITNLARLYKPSGCIGYISSKLNNIVIVICEQYLNENTTVQFLNDTKMYYLTIINYNCPNMIKSIPKKKINDTFERILGGDDYIATAGHCDPSGIPSDFDCYLDPWNSTDNETLYYIGQFADSFLEPIDFGLINIQNKNIEPIPSIRNMNSSKYPELIIEDVTEVSSNGAHLCLSGYFSHVKCGYVESLNGFASIGILGLDGDSGGSIFSYKQRSSTCKFEWYTKWCYLEQY